MKCCVAYYDMSIQAFEYYTCWQVRDILDETEDFFKQNARRKKDAKILGMYIEDVYRFLDKCDCDDIDRCKTCKPSQHDGSFCKCEERNIRIAKRLRISGNKQCVNKNIDKEKTQC